MPFCVADRNDLPNLVYRQKRPPTPPALGNGASYGASYGGGSEVLLDAVRGSSYHGTIDRARWLACKVVVDRKMEVGSMASLEFVERCRGIERTGTAKTRRAQTATRRTFLRVGSAAAAYALSGCYGVAAEQAARTALTTGKKAIFLFLHGGPSQFETFDPKPDAPAEIRSVYGPQSTTVPGTLFSANMPKLSRWAHRVAIVRSFQSGSSAHKLQPIVYGETLNANMGSLVAKVAGANDPQSGMPTNVGLFPKAVDSDLNGPIDNFGNFASTGELGLATSPFLPGGDGALQEAMKLHLSRERLEDRRALLTGLDRVRRTLDQQRQSGLDSIQQQAFDTILNGVVEAFDLSKEDPRTIARYDTTDFYLPETWQDKNNRERYGHNAKALGRLLLLARRLCEAGCTFVTVSTDFVWDMHADVNNLGVERGMQVVGRPFDHALSAYIEDVENRGLQDDILLVATGEMGRTPKINAKGGRDHWGGLTPLLVHGGGLTDGQLIGQSTPDGAKPATTPVTGRHLMSTIMNTILDTGLVRVERGLSAELLRATTEYPTIPGLG